LAVTVAAVLQAALIPSFALAAVVVDHKAVIRQNEALGKLAAVMVVMPALTA
jgi:hypothetical protein